jgi:hypothetical protein
MSYDSINLPWSLRNVKGLFWGIIMGSVAVPIVFIGAIFVGGPLDLMFFGFPVLLLLVMGMYFIYKPAKRFSEVVEALNFDLLDVKKTKLWTMKFTTLTEGEFSLYYFSGSKNRSAYYRLWITTPKKVPTEYPDQKRIWTRPSWFDRKKEKPPSNPYVDEARLEDIKSLSRLYFEDFQGVSSIEAILTDKWLYSETDDLLEALKIMREIEDRI